MIEHSMKFKRFHICDNDIFQKNLNRFWDLYLKIYHENLQSFYEILRFYDFEFLMIFFN